MGISPDLTNWENRTTVKQNTVDNLDSYYCNYVEAQRHP